MSPHIKEQKKENFTRNLKNKLASWIKYYSYLQVTKFTKTLTNNNMLSLKHIRYFSKIALYSEVIDFILHINNELDYSHFYVILI